MPRIKNDKIKQN